MIKALQRLVALRGRTRRHVAILEGIGLEHSVLRRGEHRDVRPFGTDDDMKQSVTLLRRAQEGEIAVSRSAARRAAHSASGTNWPSHGGRAGAGALS